MKIKTPNFIELLKVTFLQFFIKPRLKCKKKSIFFTSLSTITIPSFSTFTVYFINTCKKKKKIEVHTFQKHKTSLSKIKKFIFLLFTSNLKSCQHKLMLQHINFYVHFKGATKNLYVSRQYFLIKWFSNTTNYSNTFFF